MSTYSVIIGLAQVCAVHTAVMRCSRYSAAPFGAARLRREFAGGDTRVAGGTAGLGWGLDPRDSHLTAKLRQPVRQFGTPPDTP